MSSEVETSTIQELAYYWANERVVPCLVPGTTTTKSAHQSTAAFNLINFNHITLASWDDYPMPPPDFLHSRWPKGSFDKADKILGQLTEDITVPLDEGSVESMIVAPIERAVLLLYRDIYGVRPQSERLGIHTQRKNLSRTSSDIGTFPTEPNDSGRWVVSGPAASWDEMKSPRSGHSKGMNIDMKGLEGTRLDAGNGDGNISSLLKLLGQVTELCESSTLRVGYLLAPPLCVRPVYLSEVVDKKATLYVAKNLIPGRDDSTTPVERRLMDPAAWEACISRIAWKSFCVWVESEPGAREAVSGTPEYRDWVDVIKRTLSPGESRPLNTNDRLIPFSRVFRPIFQLLRRTRHSAWSLAFSSLGPLHVFKFLASFRVSDIHCASTITYPNIVYHDIIKPMHALGWHHHDIKPSNVTKDVSGRIHLIDFDAAVPAARCEGYCPDIDFLEGWGVVLDKAM
ncbi:hypothetical protein MD484_g7807, partial [Candolleomyces efflorescens]